MSQDHIVVYAFGDQTYVTSGLLSTLLRQHDTLVSELAVRTTRRLQQEIAELGAEQRAQCPRFATLLDLIPYQQNGTLAPALCQALTCFAHIGAFLAIHGAERDSKPYPTSSAACLTGVCTGSISAAAIGHSSNACELVQLGEEGIALAFRVGALAADMGGRIAPRSDAAGAHPSWAAAVVGDDIDVVKQRLEEVDNQISSAPYISARVSANQINVSAAPHTLDDFLQTLNKGSPASTRHATVSLPVHAPYHAPHLYCESDVERVIRHAHVSRGNNASHDPIPIISTCTGRVVSSGTFNDALRSAAADCLQHVVRYDLLSTAVASLMSSKVPCSGFLLQPVAIGASERLQSAIRSQLNSVCSLELGESFESVLEKQRQEETPNRTSQSKIAVLSCAGRFPRASNMHLFWDVLLHGVDTHKMVPITRWDARTHTATAPTEKNVSGVGFGCWLEDASAFDASFFNVSPREAPQMDPAQRLALMCATEAIEEAGIVPGRTPSTQHNRIGVYFGVTSNDWMETNSAQNIDTYFIPGGNRAFIAGRVNYHFKFSGPSYSIDTACSSSLTAIQLACNALWRREIDMAVVGGTNILTNPDMHCGLDRGHFLSRTGNCKTFDDSADGYCRGEAVAVVVLKRLEDAIQDHDPVRACILSVATNHSADAASITRPHIGAQRELIDRVLREAGVSGCSISYAEMHGTGTQAGDVAETNSVLDSLASPHMRRLREPLYIGSAKANVGHGEAAAGITSLAKVLLMLEHNTIPPHCGIKTNINHRMPDLTQRNALIATEPVSWNRPEGGFRRVLVNNFSAAGGNTALILEDPPLMPVPARHHNKAFHTVVASARTDTSLRRNVQSILDWIDRQDISDASLLPALAYTTTTRRMHHRRRVTARGYDLKAIQDQLRRSLDDNETNRSKSPSKILFAFAGQGSEFSRMSVGLYLNVPHFRHDIETYDRICLRMSLPSILGLFTSHDSWDLATPQVLQLAAVCLQMALVRMWRSFGVVPTSVIGHSLGEYPALYEAGVLSQCDVIFLVGKRAALMQEHCIAGSHGMLVVRSSLANIEALLRPLGYKYEVACVNGQRSVVLGGTKAELNLVHGKLDEQGVKTAELPLPYAFHTTQVDPILDDLEALSARVSFSEQKVPVISPTYAGIPSNFSSTFAVNHCRRPVEMHDALESARARGIIDERTICIEIGSAAVTSQMVKDVTGPSTELFPSMRHGEHVSQPLSLALARLHERGSAIDWDAFHQMFSPGQRIIELPTYAWDLKDYWMPYTNDWSLRKGDAIAAPSKPALLSSTIHRVVTDTLHDSAGQLIVESDLGREDMGAVVQGHKVYGVPLCTPSVYADIALTIGQHLGKSVFSKNASKIEIADMDIQSALVVLSGAKAQVLRTVVTLDRTSKTARCTFSSLTDSIQEPEQHARCTLRFPASNTAGLSSLDVLPRIDALYKQVGASGSETYRFSKSMIYKMVNAVAEFDDDYRGLAEIVMDNHAFEATGRIEFAKSKLLGGDFYIHPALIDALSQLGGFVMNANENTNLSSEIFVNHGWRSFQVFKAIEPSRQYQSHVRMSEGNDKLWSGDVTILDGEQLVAKFDGIALQRVPRRLMEYIVNAARTRAAAACGIAKPDRSVTVSKAPGTEGAITRLKSNAISFDAVLAIISSESGIALEDLADDRNFDDLGVDSLLSLMIESRIRDELAIGLERSIILELGSIGALRAYINGLDDLPVVDHPSLGTEPEHPSADAVWSSILAIISQETGVSTQDLFDDCSLADIGVDSLLSLVISSRLREELHIDLTHVSLFIDCDTIGCLRARIPGLSDSLHSDTDDVTSETASTSSSSRSSSSLLELSPPETPLTPLEHFTDDILPSKDGVEKRTARCMTLQGNTKTATQRLFLFPDGGGSATSYAKLPLISSTWAVIAFDSPFVREPQLMKSSSLAALLETYLTALRQHQPRGPYHLGGWSAGGILAYAIASKLLAANEEVSSLILIDSPSPAQGIDRLPQSFFDHCSSIGIFESEMNERTTTSPTPKPSAPHWLIPHFHATIELLHEYRALPLPQPKKGAGPSVTIIWAGACAFDDQKYAGLPDEESHSSSEIEGIQFLTQRRTDFGPGKWAQLFPGQEVMVHTMEGEHHFSMMRRGASELARIIRNALVGSGGR